MVTIVNISVLAIVIVFSLVVYFITSRKYKRAIQLAGTGATDEAKSLFMEIFSSQIVEGVKSRNAGQLYRLSAQGLDQLKELDEVMDEDLDIAQVEATIQEVKLFFTDSKKVTYKKVVRDSALEEFKELGEKLIWSANAALSADETQAASVSET